MKNALFVAVFFVLAIGVSVFVYLRMEQSRMPTEDELRNAVAKGDLANITRYASILMKSEKATDAQLLKIGEGLQRVGLLEDAMAAYSKVSDLDPKKRSTARWAIGEIYFFQSLLTESLKAFDESLALDDANDKVRDRRIYILHLTGQRWKALPDVLWFTDRDNWDFDRMRFVGNHAKPVEEPGLLQDHLKKSPSDPMAKLGLSRIAVREGRYQDAIQLLSKEILVSSPGLVEAHVQLGLALLATSPEELRGWNANLPKESDEHPDIWWIRGKFAMFNKDVSGASRCFSEAIRLDPDHHAAIVAMAQSLAMRGDAQDSQRFQDRAEVLERLLSQLDQVNPKTSYFPPVEQMAILTHQLGRLSEAWAWTRMGLVLDSKSKTLRAIYNELKEPFVKGGNRLPRYTDVTYLVSGEAYRDLPLPDFSVNESKQSKSAPSAADSASGSTVLLDRLVETDSGIDFEYFCSRPEPIVGRRMHESTGGGVGVIDYDRDGWPDLFLAQGCEWPKQMTNARYVDQLCRNQSGSAQRMAPFVSVRDKAGIDESGFGQGVAVGDVNNDGFPDLYVANIGLNQLWINQGDGTFRSGNDLLPEAVDAWTVSVAMVDLNNDGLLEMYDARYVEGEDVYTKLCNVQGQPRTCPPTIFQPSKARWLRPNQVGGFEDFSAEARTPDVKEGNALGVVAFRMDQSPLMSLFVANDQVANLLMMAREPSSPSQSPVFSDEAMERGIALDYQGRAQACMGVATGDINDDGRLDFIVTNFLGEHNAVYVQNELGGFDDVAGVWGLVEPSLPMLGFGTQLLDVDNDGDLDLLVLNGHIDDMSHAGRAFKMVPQFFENNGRGRFVERKSGEHPFFSIPALGRALATFDWNRDGSTDAVGTDLEKGFRILTNQPNGSKSVSIELVGTDSQRDAIGTELRASVGGRQLYRQLVSGDGYMCTSQKIVHFGLGESDRLSSLEISWPSGLKETHSNIPPDSAWVAIERVGIFPR
ncbi:MAG: FG-GAP-like repeat-containing protein [Pirellula sp.]|nr:FG-GAP-like repeat-containing protein [Pirellula sp.]